MAHVSLYCLILLCVNATTVNRSSILFWAPDCTYSMPESLCFMSSVLHYTAYPPLQKPTTLRTSYRVAPIPLLAPMFSSRALSSESRQLRVYLSVCVDLCVCAKAKTRCEVKSQRLPFKSSSAVRLCSAAGVAAAAAWSGPIVSLSDRFTTRKGWK